MGKRSFRRINSFRRLICGFLSILLLGAGLSGLSCLSASADAVSNCKQGDLIEFGSYPQSLVTDSKLISALNKQPGDWKSFGYYYGDNAIGTGNHFQGDFMRYKDVSYESQRYRAVYFFEYRPANTASPLGDKNYEYFLKNSMHCRFEKETVYWFLYEPVRWKILDVQKGLLLSDTVLDAQPFSNTIYRPRYEYRYYKDSTCSSNPSEWADSDLRQWLNADFYNTTFSAYEKTMIQETDVKIADTTVFVSYEGDRIVHHKSTTDKVFLLSKTDVFNNRYGFYPQMRYENLDMDRAAKISSYALCNFTANNGYGFEDWGKKFGGEFDPRLPEVAEYIRQESAGNCVSSWWTCTSHGESNVFSCGIFSGNTLTCYTDGVRPAITVDPKKDLAPPRSIATMYGDVDLDGKVTAKDARLALRYSARLETLSAIQIANAAVINQDNTTVTAADARKILRYSAKLEPSFPKVVKPTAFRSPDGVFEKKDANIELNGVIAAVGMKWSELSGLGNPSGRTEVPALYGSNVDIIYSFSGFEVYTTIIDGVETVYEIDLNSPKYATPKGIRVGSTAVDVLDRYGEYPETMTDECFSYFSECNGIDFQIHAGVVIGIQIYTTS